MKERIFCAAMPGLEPVVADELRALGLAARPVDGGAEAEGEDAVAVACLGARTAESVLLRLWEGPAGELPRAKREAAARLPGVELQVRPGSPATVSADAAGAPLYKRGWRARVGAAPLRETVAAAILRWAGWDGTRPFLDPMCGSGTLAIEAALAACGIAPGVDREFAFERWPGHDAARTADVRARLRAGGTRRPVGVLAASDRNAGALRLAMKNAEAAGVARELTFSRADAATVVPPPGGPGLCAVNPPWGLRLDEGAADGWRALAALLPRLGGWDLVVLGADRGLERLLPRRPERALEVRIGGVACRLLHHRP
ncbi:MAG: RNA methyltransferase [Anaeromyxobacteraceae bacterium]